MIRMLAVASMALAYNAFVIPSNSSNGPVPHAGVVKNINNTACMSGDLSGISKRTPLPCCYDGHIPHTDIKDRVYANTYTSQEMEQFLEGHIDAMDLCRNVIDEADKNPGHFHQLFGNYFDMADMDIVLNVFKAVVDFDGQNKGSPKFEAIDVIDDHNPKLDRDFRAQIKGIKVKRPSPTKRASSSGQGSSGAGGDGGDLLSDLKPSALSHDYSHESHFCGDSTTTVTNVLKPSGRTTLILCPRIFAFGTIQGGANREWPGVRPVTCDTIGDRVSDKMITTGKALLNEYIRFPAIVQPILMTVTGDTDYGFENTRNLGQRKIRAKYNADSYASFAAELTWSRLCKKDFLPPSGKAPEGGKAWKPGVPDYHMGDAPPVSGPGSPGGSNQGDVSVGGAGSPGDSYQGDVSSGGASSLGDSKQGNAPTGGDNSPGGSDRGGASMGKSGSPGGSDGGGLPSGEPNSPGESNQENFSSGGGGWPSSPASCGSPQGDYDPDWSPGDLGDLLSGLSISDPPAKSDQGGKHERPDSDSDDVDDDCKRKKTC